MAKISDDGKSVTCYSANGRLMWTRYAPSYADWQRLAKRPVAVDLAAGVFRYVGDELEGVIIAVFTPGRGLDFNLTYTAETGDLIRINEAR